MKCYLLYSDIRMGDVLQGLLNAESELSKSLDLIGTESEDWLKWWEW